MYLEYTPSLAPVAKPGIHPKSGQKSGRGYNVIRVNGVSGKKKFVCYVECSVIRSYFIREFLDITYGRQADSLQVW